MASPFRDKLAEAGRLIRVARAYIDDGAYRTAAERLLKAAAVLESAHVQRQAVLEEAAR